MPDDSNPRVLHAALIGSYEPGITQQAIWETRAANRMGLPWRVAIYSPAVPNPNPEGIFVQAGPSRGGRLRRLVGLRREFYSWLETESVNYDIVILRHNTFDPFRVGAVRRIQALVASVHHTLEVPELEAHSKGVSRLIQVIMERTFGPRSVRASDVVVGVTREIAAYEAGRSGSTAPIIVYPNGVDLDETQVVVDDRGELPEILFVAGSFKAWHGLDLLLDSFSESTEDCILHVVGNAPSEVLSKVATDRRVQVHGTLTTSEIREIAGRCWLALSSFGLHRQSMSEACPLKTREYLSFGLPVAAGHRDVFPDNFDYFTRCSPHIDELLAVAAGHRGRDRETVRAAASPYISKVDLLRGLNVELQYAMNRG